MQISAHSNQDDFVLTDCLIYDGTGSAQIVGDIFVSGDRICFVDRNHSVSHAGYFSRSLKGYAVAPGFIDVHGHSDISICACPSAFGKISQGVTTELVGNCGLSVFPISESVREHLNEMYSPYSEKITWNDFNGYAEEIRKRSPSINIGSLCGHNTLRASVTGYEKREISESEINMMRHHLSRCLMDGAFGFSTGLLYVPGIFSSKNELLRIMEILKQYDAVYATHLRSEGTKLLEAVAEAVELAGAGAGRLQISHLKTAGKANWSKLDDVFRMIREASDAGMKITADRYPYTYSQTS